jgi:hypothetical protein
MLAGCSSDGNGGGDETAAGGGAESTPQRTGTDAGTDDRTNRFAETVRFPRSYAMTATVRSDGRTTEMTGRFHRGDTYWSFDQQGQQMEMYRVGNSTYTVAGGQCFRGTMRRGMNRPEADPGRFAEQPRANPDATPVGRDTIDGEDVLVYELPRDGSRQPVTYYVLADSGYPRRIEAESMRWDFHSWGSVDPIRKPEGDCQSMPGGMTVTGGT